MSMAPTDADWGSWRLTERVRERFLEERISKWHLEKELELAWWRCS